MNLSRFNLLLLPFAASAAVLTAQTLYVPGGTSGIGNNTANGNVGIGTTTPTAAKLVVASPQSSATNTVVAEFTKDGGTNLFGSAILRLSRSLGGESTDIELNSGGSGPFRYGTYADSIFASNQNYSNGPYGSIQFVTNNAARLTIGGGTLAGNVGIGTGTPEYALDVNGVVRSTVSSGSNVLITKALGGSIAFQDGTCQNSMIESGSTANSNHLEFWTNTPTNSGLVERMRIDSTGNVGIGTTNPTQKLSVNGAIRAKEVVVDTGWSDYVFAPDYQLPALSTIEAHIKAEKHLPGIPSAQEVAEHGISVGEMQAKLLAKIEELTLHVIEQEKAISSVRVENAALRSEVESLKTTQQIRDETTDPIQLK